MSTPHVHYWEAWSAGFNPVSGILHARCVSWDGHCPVGARAFTREQWARAVDEGRVSPNSWGWAAGTREHLSIQPSDASKLPGNEPGVLYHGQKRGS